MTTVKPGPVTFVAVDGGMADNLEVALVGQRFEATIANRVGGGDPVAVVGRHCESGDVLVDRVPLREPHVGDLLAVPATGAYCYTMSKYLQRCPPHPGGFRRRRCSSARGAPGDVGGPADARRRTLDKTAALSSVFTVAFTGMRFF